MTEITRRLPKLASQRSIPNEVKAAIGKLGADPHGTGSPRQNVRLPDGRVMAHIANTTIGNIRDAKNLFQVLPDMDYARQILISATISPGDLTDSKVLYSVNDDALDSNLTGPLLRSTQEFFDDSYRIRSLLHPMLNDIMFETGSYPLLVMPESSIDRIINADNYSGVSMESAITTLDSHIREQTDDTGKYNSWGVLGPGAPTTAAAKAKVDSYTGVSFEALANTAAYDGDIKFDNFNVSLESMIPETDDNRELRVKLAELGKAASTRIASMESSVTVLDNLNILKRPMVLDTRRKLAVRRIYGGKLHGTASLESLASNGNVDAKRNLKAIQNSMYTKRRYQHVPVQPLMTHAQTNMETYGHPLVLHLPSESVIPIHVPGNPSEHVGYYVMLDIDGNPICVADQMSYLDDIRAQMNNVDSQASQLIQQARRGFEGMGGVQNEIIDELGKIYSETVEADLLARLRSGAMSGNYELGKTQNVNRLMLARERQAARLILEGAQPQQVDRVLTEFGLPMGTFELQDMAGGIEIGYRRRQETGDQNWLMDRFYELGRLGQKTSKGYYRYEPGKRTPLVDPEVTALLEEASARAGITRRAIGDEELRDRLILPMINEGVKLIEEGIVERASDIDAVWLSGFGWPTWKGGPMYWADTQGAGPLLARMNALHASHGEAFKPATLLERLSREGGSFVNNSATI